MHSNTSIFRAKFAILGVALLTVGCASITVKQRPDDELAVQQATVSAVQQATVSAVQRAKFGQDGIAAPQT